MRFSFTHSHAFPGGRLTIEDAEATEGSCAVEFSDVSAMIGEWHHDGTDILKIPLKIPAYRTAKGTDVAAQSWRVVQNKDGEWRSLPLATSARRRSMTVPVVTLSQIGAAAKRTATGTVNAEARHR